MNKQKMLLGAGLVMFGVSAAHGASMMPTNPMGTVFAPWNTMPGMPGGFSPLNNGFTSGGPMGISPFSMSPYGGNGSPWGSMPSTMMPWNAWSSSPGSIVPWGNQMPWGTNNSGMFMPWGNNFNPWNSWTGNRINRNRNNNRDALRTMLLMQELSGQQNLPGLMPGMTGLPPLSATPMMAPSQTPAKTLPVLPPPQNTQNTAVAQPKVKAPAVPAAAQGFSNPFSDPTGKGATATAESNNYFAPAPSFNPFANNGAAVEQQNQQHGLQFPDADSFFVTED